MEVLYNIHILNHNYDPESIINILTGQICKRKEKIILTIWDDYSDPSYRQTLSDLQSLNDYSFLSWNLEKNNTGRSGMRQKILKSCRAGWIVSIDSDMEPDPDFIDKMVTSLKDDGTVYTGYHSYQNKPPQDPYVLHWTYGRKREVAAQNKNPYTHFSTGIFAIHSTLAERLNFEKSITGYGHEDTLFGLLLMKNKIPIRLTTMKAIHQGLSPKELFIAKQLESVGNLKMVLSIYPGYQNRMIRWARRINRVPLLRKWLIKNQTKNYLLKRLQENPKRLIYLDLLKIIKLLRGF